MMKLFTIATFFALPSVNAVYYACCKREDSCPMGRNNTGTGDGSFEVCCDPGLSANGAELDEIPVCLDDIPTEGGVSIALYNSPEVTATSNAPEVMSTSNTSEVTTTSTNECCLALAAAQPGKIRSATTSVCPETMHYIDNAMHVEDETNYQVCCGEGSLASKINTEGLPACEVVSTQTPDKPIDAAPQPQQGTNLEDGSNSTTQTPVESSDIDADVPPQQETNPDDGSNSANAMNTAMIGIALVGAALQAAM